MIFFRLLARDAVKLGEDCEVFQRAQFQVAGHGLRNDADGLAHVVGLAHDVEVVDARRAGGRRHEGGQHADQGGFAGAVGTEQAENLAVAHGKIQPVHGDKIAEAFR